LRTFAIEQLFKQESEIRALQSALIMEQDRNQRFIAGNQDLLNKLVSDKLAPSASVPDAQTERIEPVQTRKPQWNKIRAEYEAKKRHEYWASRIAEVEERDREHDKAAAERAKDK
jgi:hypothetical protein